MGIDLGEVDEDDAKFFQGLIGIDMFTISVVLPEVFFWEISKDGLAVFSYVLDLLACSIIIMLFVSIIIQKTIIYLLLLPWLL